MKTLTSLLIGYQLSAIVEDLSDKTRQKMSVTNDYSRLYERDSMYLFGDDLTEDVLSYLWLEDKVKLEYVCHRWQRLVFNQQTEICNNSYLDFNRQNSLYNLFVQ